MSALNAELQATSMEQKDECQEYSIQPDHLTDFTVYFGSASFHLHRLTLYAESKYFAAFLSPDVQGSVAEECRLTEHCRRHGHQCVSLPGSQIRGQDVTCEELKQFFEHLSYGIERNSLSEWRKRLKVGGLVDYQGEKGTWETVEIEYIDNYHATMRIKDQSGSVIGPVGLDMICLQQAYSMKSMKISKWKSTLQVGDHVICQDTKLKWYLSYVLKNGETRIHIHYIGWEPKWDEWIAHDSFRIVPSTNPCVPYHDNMHFNIGVHLSHFFDCHNALQRYRFMTKLYSKDSTPRFDRIWVLQNLLLVSERCHWDDAMSDCITQIVNSSKPVLSGDALKLFCDPLSRSTLMELFRASLNQNDQQ